MQFFHCQMYQIENETHSTSFPSENSYYIIRGGQSATSATSAIAEVALRFNFLFWNIAKVALRSEFFLNLLRFNCAALSVFCALICCALIALHFQFFFFFSVNSAFCTLNLILFHFDRNFDKYRPSLANYFLFFCLKSKKMRYLHCVVKFQLRKLDCALTRYKNAVPQLRNCVALQLNQKIHCGIWATLQKLKN